MKAQNCIFFVLSEYTTNPIKSPMRTKWGSGALTDVHCFFEREFAINTDWLATQNTRILCYSEMSGSYSRQNLTPIAVFPISVLSNHWTFFLLSEYTTNPLNH